MSKSKVKKDIKNGVKIDVLKVKRNLGELTPEVVRMCCNQLDEMVNVAGEHAGKNNKRDLSGMVNELKSNPKMLIEVCKFAEVYEEVIRWNHLNFDGKIPLSVTISHREVDLAMFDKICATYRDTYANDISYMLWNYANARLEIEKKASKKTSMQVN